MLSLANPEAQDFFDALHLEPGLKTTYSSMKEDPISFRSAINDTDFTVGEYFMTCSDPNAVVKFSSEMAATEDREAESDRREHAFILVDKVNIHRNNPERRLQKKNHGLLREFFHTNAGAWFARRILKETLWAAQKGYLEYTQNLESFCQSRRKIPLHEVLSGEISFDGQLQQDFIFFEINEHGGPGAFAQPGFISISAVGIGGRWSVTRQKVDPLAIISHELGHTRYGDSSTGGHLLGERQTVINFENPVRKLNGYAPRRGYYSHSLNQTIEIESSIVHKGQYYVP